MKLSNKILYLLSIFIVGSCSSSPKENKTIPCKEKAPIIVTLIAWDSVKVVSKIIPICNDEHSLTYKKGGKEIKNTTKQKFKVRIVVASDSNEFSFSQKSNGKENLLEGKVQEAVDIVKNSFDDSDTSIIIEHYYFSNGVSSLTMRWKVRYNSGFDYLGSVSRSDIK